MPLSDRTLAWLLAGDPSIRWQVHRDLLGSPERVWNRERNRVAREGWGARLLSKQDGEGNWTRTAYGPRWISTFYTLQQLRDLGLAPGHPIALKACRILLDQGLYRDGGINLSVSKDISDVCVTGMALRSLSWFGWEEPRLERMIDYLLGEQMPDGGWNCLRHRNATHASFHSTLSVLEGIREFRNEAAYRKSSLLRAEERGRDFLLRHRLMVSHRTGKVFSRDMLAFHFPPRWKYDVLRALEHFREAGADRDPRLLDAVRLLEGKRDGQGRLKLAAHHPGAQWFRMEEAGKPSRWNTLRGTRVLEWWSSSSRSPTSRPDPVPRSPFGAVPGIGRRSNSPGA